MTLRVTIEIIPFGDESNKRTLHVVNISNTGKVERPGMKGLGLYNYIVREIDENGKNLEPYTCIHQRSQGFWDLIYRAVWPKLMSLEDPR